jgi:ABC-2 type transport system permease protein
MMFLLMVRVTDPLMPRAIFGVLNTAALFPERRGLSAAGFPRGCR